MAFTLRNLSVLAYANGFTLWHYRAGNDALDLLDQAGYFADAGDLMAPGDILMASSASGARVATVQRAETSLCPCLAAL
ncbi:MAG TPA: hypothetical protein PK677_07545 [Acidiphilium sp.]|nr:MAG: hypothetical protein B7Z67_06645 [Acidiphilium sp. 21-60-14]OYV91971.1 MAG: hypothetical protein B7Z57_02555 [Acidiphilium sp. 37-60-79]OZB39187.1 MAG: hypothetical protein B7X48_10200 [Acidiphilium sp. 34-60-192]HQT88396.1 hypothetical protein [Acidiphilium sp.]HQU23924.1 hypothetical protein [Acidiphilium sp.]